MSLSKKNKFKEFGIRTGEALDLLYDIINQDESIYKQNRKEALALIAAVLAPTRKRTIHHVTTFENKARAIIEESKEKINNGNYLEVAKKILDLFRDEAKSKTRLYLDENSSIITMVLTFISAVASISGIIISLTLR